MTIKHFTLQEVFSFGWEKTKQHYWYMLCTFAIYGVIIYAIERSGWFEVLISLLIALSLVSISLVIARNESFGFSTLFDKLRHPKVVINFLLLTALYVLAVAVFFIPFLASIFVMGNAIAGGVAFTDLPGRLFGILFVTTLLTIPAIIISVRFKFYPYVLVEHENISFMDVIKQTFAITRGYFWKILMFLIILGIFNMIGAVTYVGLLLTIPITVFAMAHFYRHLAGHQI